MLDVEGGGALMDGSIGNLRRVTQSAQLHGGRGADLKGGALLSRTWRSFAACCCAGGHFGSGGSIPKGSHTSIPNGSHTVDTRAGPCCTGGCFGGGALRIGGCVCGGSL